MAGRLKGRDLWERGKGGDVKGEKEKALGRGGKREIRGERERWRIWVHVNEEEQARRKRDGGREIRELLLPQNKIIHFTCHSV